MCSIVAAKQGSGSMAVSNAIGSNVFDILVGLGLPWLVQTAFVEPGSSITLATDNVLIPVIILLVTLVTVVAAFAISKWKLTRKLGLVLILIYIGYIIYNIVTVS